MSGVTVATTIIPISSGLTPLAASNFFAASVPRCDAATPGSAWCRSRMPVRVRIHSSEVSIIFSRSKFVTTRGGTCPRRRAALWECGSLLPLSPRRSLPAALNFGGLASARRASSLLCALRLFSVSSVVRFFTPLAFLSVLCACPPSCWAGLCGEICSRFPRQNLVSPRNLRRLPQHRRHRTIFRLAQLDRVAHRLLVERPSKPVNDFNLRPNLRRLRRPLARNQHFQRFQLLPLLRQYHRHVHRRARPQRAKQHLHRPRTAFVRASRVELNRFARWHRRQKFLAAHPLHRSCPHHLLAHSR